MSRLLPSLALAGVVLLGAALVGTAAVPARAFQQPSGKRAESLPSPRIAKPDVNLTDNYEMLIYAKHRPIRIAVTVLYEGKRITDRWVERLRGAFDYFDRDHDGVLNESEVKTIFGDSALSVTMQNGFYTPNPSDLPTLARLDSDADGRVSFVEFVAYYKNAAAQVLRTYPPLPENATNTQTTEALFKLFDVNGDGKLTKDEVSSAEKLLAMLDSDEDECLGIAELLPNQFNPQLRFVNPVQVNGQPPPPQAPRNVETFASGRIPGVVIQRIIKDYDKNGDFELSLQESGFSPSTFTRLDTNHDGKLSGEELDVWRTGPADLDVTLSLAPKAVDCNVTFAQDTTTIEERGFSIRRIENGRVQLRYGRQYSEFWAYSPVLGGGNRLTVKQQLAGLFQAAGGAKGYLDDKDFTGNNAVQYQLIRVMLDPADVNGDGRMTQAEFDAYLDMQQTFVDLSLSLTPTVQTPTLFQLLDENQDGRLSVRELRTAWDRLLALEEPGAREISRNIIQPTITMRVTRVVDRFVGNQPVFANPNGMGNAAPTKGPLWFRKMDRNADGDISRAEFLGTRAEFDVIDTNHDGLISLEEAESYDKAQRPMPLKK